MYFYKIKIFLYFILIIFTSIKGEAFIKNKWLESLWGTPETNRMYGGLQVYHFEPKSHHNNQGDLVGFVYEGLCFSTFKNSHHIQSYTLGIQRVWGEFTYQDFSLRSGIKVGGIYGYKNYRFSKSRDGEKNWLLIGLPYFNLQYKKVGLEVQYFFAACTFGLYFNN